MSVYSNFFMYWNKPESRRFYVRKYNYIKTLIKLFNKISIDEIEAFKSIDLEKLEEFNFYWDRWGQADKDSSENIITKDRGEKTVYWIDVEHYLEGLYNLFESIYLFIFYTEINLDSAPHPNLKGGLI